MSNLMLSEKDEGLSKISNRRELKRRERKIWKKPIKISGFSNSDFTSDQIPIIFSGYSAESEDSSSYSEMSDDSKTNQEIDQEISKSVKKRSKLSRISSIKILKRQSTRKLKKMRSIKRLTSNSRKKKKNLDDDDDELGFIDHQPRYLRPTSSSASKNVENNNQKNLGVTKLKTISSLRYNGLLKATCSSAMKGGSSSSTNDVCNYRYCSLHHHHHRPHNSHNVDNGVIVPSLKRFVSMRRKFLKRQKSVNRRLVLLKRSLSRKNRIVSSDHESNQELFDDDDEEGSISEDLESNERSIENVIIDDNEDGDQKSVNRSLSIRIASDQESNQKVFDEEASISENSGNDLGSNVRSSENVMVCVDDNGDRSKPEIMNDLDDGIEKNTAQSHGLSKQDLASFDHDDEKVEVKKVEPEIMNDSNVMDLDYDNVNFEETKSEEKDGKETENVWNDTVALVKQAFDEILEEITDDDSSDESSNSKNDDIGSDSSDSSSLDMKPIQERDKSLFVTVSTSHMVKEVDHHQRGSKNWSYLKRVILLKRFLKSLNRRKRNETMKLRKELIGEKKNSEEWMLDHALRQVISTLDPSQKRKVKPLVKAFESLLLVDNGSRSIDDLGNGEREKNESVNSKTSLKDDKDTSDVPRKDLGSGEREGNESVNSQTSLRDEKDTSDVVRKDLGSGEREENESVNSETSLRDDKDTSDVPRKDLEEAKLTSEADANSSQDLDVEEELDGLALDKEEKTRDSEKKNLSTWRDLIQKNLVNRDEIQKEHIESYGTNQDVNDSEAVESFQKAFESILSEIPNPRLDDKEEKKEQEETKKSWNSLRKVILLKRFVKSLENVHVLNPRKLRNLPELDAENVLLRHRSMIMNRRKDGEELMLDYAMRQAISRLDPIGRKKVELLVQAFDSILDGSKNNEEEEKPRVIEDYEVIKDAQRIRKDLKEEEVDSKSNESINLPPPIQNFKPRIVVEKEKDSRLWKLIYKHMVTEKEETDSTNGESLSSLDDDEANGVEIDSRRSNTVTLVREALEKILSEIPDNSSDDQSMASNLTADQELFERSSQVSEESITFKPKSNEKRVKGWNNVKKVILLRRFVSDLGRLNPKNPRFLPLEQDQETEKINLRHQTIGEKKNSEEWMMDYALRQAISTLAPSQRRKVSFLAQAFDTISLQDIGSGSIPSSRNISRQSSLASMSNHSENDANVEIIRSRLMKLQEETTKQDLVEEKQQCSSLWKFLCKQMEDNERNQTLPQETREQEQDQEEETNVDGEKIEHYQTEAVELLGEVIDEISLEETQEKSLKVETLSISKVKSNRWSNLKRMILLRRFVKALENVKRINSKESRFSTLNNNVEAERVNLRHLETQNSRNGDEWMVDNALQEVVSKLTPERKLKVHLLVQAFETLSAT